MNVGLLEFLVCPECKAELLFACSEADGAEILSGQLTCEACQAEYPILRGVPRFITGDKPLSGKQAETAEAFGWEWKRFPSLHELSTYEEQFKDWIHPIEPKAFRDRVVLDAGCGMGRFSLVSARFGARAVLAVDASEAVEVAYLNLNDVANAHVIQADIRKLPLRCGDLAEVELIFTIGVLHHLDNPKAGFAALARHLGSNGTIFAWVYGRENNGWIVHLVDPLRTTITSRLPRRLLYWASWVITLILQPVLRCLYRPARTVRGLGWLARFLPYEDYLAWLSQFRFRHNHHVVFDHLVAPVAHYVSRGEFESWFSAAQIELLGTSWRNRNSWRGYGSPAGPSRGETQIPHRDSCRESEQK